MKRAYAVLRVKSVDADTRIIRGTASTPEPDRMGDIIEPLGITFTNPSPLLLYHNSQKPVGQVRFFPPTKDGLDFEAELPIVDEPGTVRERIEEAWTSIKTGLLAGVSIGFRSLEEAFIKETGSYRFIKTEVLELSLVAIPANAGATIQQIKSLDQAASGRHASGSPGPLPVVRAVKTAKAMTIPEQITQFENTRAAQAAIMSNLLAKSAETGESLDEQQSTEYEDAKAKVASCDTHLTRLHDVEKLNLTKATPIAAATDPNKAGELRGGHVPVVQVKSPLPKGTAFTRMCMALARGQGDSYQTLEHARSWRDSSPEVEQMIQHMWHHKAAVAPGTTTDATWAGPLAVRQPIAEFLELLRARTLLGQIQGFKQVPFNVSVGSQTSGGTYAWVGQGLAKPVTAAAYAAVTLDFAKAAGIIVISMELAKLSTPSAEGLVREELLGGMGAFLDTQLIDPAVAAVANLNPASITNGAATIVASGVTGAAAKLDLASRVATFTAANIPLLGSVWLMSDSNAFGLGISVNALGQPLFPGLSIAGGSILGIPVVVSNNVGNRVVLVHAGSILYADEGGVQIDVSKEASIQMDSAPDSPATSTTVLVSMFQNNLIALRAERMINWKRARTAAVTYISAAAYIGT